jgi:hypothetical protein
MQRNELSEEEIEYLKNFIYDNRDILSKISETDLFNMLVRLIYRIEINRLNKEIEVFHE